MANNTIALVKVKDLFGRSFFIPSYQRGYKWKPQQVIDLLDDLADYLKPGDKQTDDFYCMQPLVVKMRKLTEDIQISLDTNATEEDLKQQYEDARKKFEWEVIDGQQRLTTIKMILAYLNEPSYSITYETREGSMDFLDKIATGHCKKGWDANSDFFHMSEVFKAIKVWFDGDGHKKPKKPKKLKQDIPNIIKDKCQFIWYQCDEDAIKVFTRLNIGKIGLTNSELIKATMLSKASTNSTTPEQQEGWQREVSNEWNTIEYTLQNDELWLFIHTLNYDKPTRIDFLFDIICNLNLLELEEDFMEKLGTDKYRTFRYFDLFFSNKIRNPQEHDATTGDSQNCWQKIMTLYQTILEWYNDVELYHLVGYVIDRECASVSDLYKLWQDQKTKNEFKEELRKKIAKKLGLKECTDIDKDLDTLLDKQYEVREDGDDNGSAPKKTDCYPILLLHNVLTAIEQNKISREKNPFRYEVFFRYPFYLMKRDKWDVEHIDSNTTNGLNENIDKLLWLLQYKDNERLGDYKDKLDKAIKKITERFEQDKRHDEDAIKKMLKGFNFDDYFKEEGETNFEAFQGRIIEALESKEDEKTLNHLEKNRIWNFVLLDAKTNRSYGNSIFPSKRRTIMAKDRRCKCVLYLANGEFGFDIIPDYTMAAFVPPITRNVFMKYYTPATKSFISWDIDDATAYRKVIKESLKKFFGNE